MRTTTHKNQWFWGDCDTIIAEGGEGIICVSVEKKNPSTAFIHDLSVIPERQRNGIATKLLYLALLTAKEKGCATAELSAEERWIEEWYKRKGFQKYASDENLVYLRYENLQSTNISL